MELAVWLDTPWKDYQVTWALVDEELHALCQRRGHERFEDVYTKVAMVNSIGGDLMAGKKGSGGSGWDPIAKELKVAAAAIAVIVIREVVNKTPQAVEWTVKNAAPVVRKIRLTGLNGIRAVKRDVSSAGGAAKARVDGLWGGRGDEPPSGEQETTQSPPGGGAATRFTRTGLQSYGFSGFVSVGKLQTEDYDQVPTARGVYVVVRESQSDPVFLTASIGGHFKDKDPTVPVPTLRDNWIDGSQVLYIGQAGGAQSSSTLNERVKALVQFAHGKRVAHWGGRLLWQVEGSHEFLVAWKRSIDEDPLDEETRLIDGFRQAYGDRPFANLQK